MTERQDIKLRILCSILSRDMRVINQEYVEELLSVSNMSTNMFMENEDIRDEDNEETDFGDLFRTDGPVIVGEVTDNRTPEEIWMDEVMAEQARQVVGVPSGPTTSRNLGITNEGTAF